MQYDNQDKIQGSSSAPQLAKAPSKAVNPTGNPTQQPTWTEALGDKPPAGQQAKLTVSQPGDPYEQEAERVAEQVMGMPSTIPEHDESLMRKEGQGSDGTQAIEGAPPIINQALSSAGQPLDAGTRTVMESRFGQDFSDVRVHTDEQAAESAEAVNARAYTVGKDVVFGAGEYEPGTSEGQRLLAHELVHVSQNRIHTNAALVKRYEGPEHQDLGDRNLQDLFEHLKTGKGKQWARNKGLDPEKLLLGLEQDPMLHGQKISVQPGLELTPGEIISLMGDFYKTWQDLVNAPVKEITDILEVMKQERYGQISSADANLKYEKITKGRYTALAKVNVTHFAPKNSEEWKKLHTEAIQKANEAYTRDDETAFQQALLIDAAGGHFLTDAFASGHLFDRPRLEVEIISYLRDHPIQAENPEMQSILGGLQMGGLAYQLVLKNIHDRINAEGLDVSNKKGMHWKTYGDNHLKNAEETRHIASLAVFLSRQQIFQAKKGESPDPTEILELIPDAESIERATNVAISYIPDAVRDIARLIHSNVGMLQTLKVPIPILGRVLPSILESRLETMSDPARQRELERIESQRPEDRPLPSQFTIFKF